MKSLRDNLFRKLGASLEKCQGEYLLLAAIFSPTTSLPPEKLNIGRMS